jgi:hypothetical protein
MGGGLAVLGGTTLLYGLKKVTDQAKDLSHALHGAQGHRSPQALDAKPHCCRIATLAALTTARTISSASSSMSFSASMWHDDACRAVCQLDCRIGLSGIVRPALALNY